MEFVDSILPWADAPVRENANLVACLGEHLPATFLRYLPRSITLFVDHEVSDAAVSAFLPSMADHLQLELARRMARQKRFVDLGLLAEEEVEVFLTQRTAAQPWAIYFSKDGGLRTRKFEPGEAGGLRGVIPCSTMQNHGVAWEQSQDGRVRIWLATARREGCDWDWESDIGHESAHAAFAQVPLFVQAFPQIAGNVLSAVERATELTPVHITQMIYLYSEIAVVAMRGESRATATGLPVAEPMELAALLRLSAELADDVGFERAIQACRRCDGRVDVNQGDEIFEIAAPMVRVIPHLTPFTADPEPPALPVFKQALASAGRASMLRGA
jgi:hypothetical protein